MKQFISFFPLLASLAASAALNNRQSPAPIFTLHDITYTESVIFSTPAHEAVADGHILFNLTNSAVPDATVQCEAYGYHLTQYFYGEFVYQCDGGPSSTFTFSRPDGVIDVNQTWTESSGNTFLGVGSGQINLNCSTDMWTNPDWTPGQLYSTSETTCAPLDLDITPVVTSE